MRAIIIGAGRGQRLMPTTADTPKCFAEVGGRRILDWTLDALAGDGVDRRLPSSAATRSTRCSAAYPELTFRHNADWANNNILASLFHAEDLMDGPFLCSLLGHPVHPRGGRALALAQPRTTWRWSWTPTGGSATRTAPSTRRTTPRR